MEMRNENCSMLMTLLKGRLGRKRGYREVFFSNFNKSVFSIFTYSEYRKLGFQKIRDFQTSVFSIFATGKYRKHGCLKISDFLKSQFSIFTRQMFGIRDFQTSVFSTFTIGEYRKHGFIKVGEKNPTFINPRFRYSPIVNIENTDVENLGFLKSEFSIFTKQMFETLRFFTTGEYRKHGYIKVGEKNPRYPRNPRFRSGPEG